MAKRVTTAEDIVDQAVALLAASEIFQIPREHYSSWPAEALAFEDEYTLVAVWLFDTFEDLEESWLAAQDNVIRLLGSTLISTDPKSWDGYLILVTADTVPQGKAALLSNIRTNTRRLRKLVVTGDDVPPQISSTLEIAPAVRRALAPIVDLTLPDSLNRADPLGSIIERNGLVGREAESLEVFLSAYRRGYPPVEALYEARQAASNDEGTVK
ncbi:hypothetical protein [Leucobacter sp. W1478]|uniref:hypothetical protein n=1 Tax=Leucobacter sp. W1478 TaxID=3439065 RepID=UPI003F365899